MGEKIFFHPLPMPSAKKRKYKYPANLISRQEAQEKVSKEPFTRKTISFYRYYSIPDPLNYRNQMYEELEELSILGRIYLAEEGINAQISIPSPHYEQFLTWVNQQAGLQNLRLNQAIENATSFYKLIIKVKKRIVADGLNADEYDLSQIGKHLNAQEFNQAIDEKETIVIDMRNHYESEVGKFENAITPDIDTFREELIYIKDNLKDKKDKKILMYCTGGIRCEKASSYLIKNGFTNVNQLEGGIINYVKQIKENNIPSKFIGKNFVFDARLGERVTDEIISQCHQCQEPCDTHTNCANDICHLLFIQCPSCNAKYENTCSEKCQKILHLPQEEKVKIKADIKNHKSYQERLRPKLNQQNKESEI